MPVKIKISLSMTAEELWEAQVKENPAFDKIVADPSGTKKALNIDDEVIDVWVPDVTPTKKPVGKDDLEYSVRTGNTPDGEPVYIDPAIEPLDNDITGIHTTRQGKS